jgi:hypothetical protein
MQKKDFPTSVKRRIRIEIVSAATAANVDLMVKLLVIFMVSSSLLLLTLLLLLLLLRYRFEEPDLRGTSLTTKRNRKNNHQKHKQTNSKPKANQKLVFTSVAPAQTEAQSN